MVKEVNRACEKLNENSLVLFGHFCFFRGLSHPAPVSRPTILFRFRLPQI